MIAVALTLLLQAYHPDSTRGWKGLVPETSDQVLADVGTGHAFVAEGLTAPLGGYGPSATLLAQDQNRLESISVSFHSIWLTDSSGRRTPIWFSRFRYAKGAAISERFADSRACPMVFDLLNVAEQIERPQLDFVGIPEGTSQSFEDAPDMALDDVSYTLSASGAFPTNHTRAQYSVSGDSLTPVGGWGRLVLASLSHCWTTVVPDDLAASR